MALRKALTYSKKYARPYTRVSRNKSKAYIKVVPANKIVKYHLGNVRAYNDGKYPYIIHLVSEENVQVRDNALEACRMLIVKQLDLKLPGQYYIEIKAHPHHILRNNKMAAGAGADRLSSGMTRSFGIVEGRAALIKAKNDILIVACETEAQSRLIREELIPVKAKVPCKTTIRFEVLKPVAQKK